MNKLTDLNRFPDPIEENYEARFKQHLDEMVRICGEISLYEEALMREIQAYAKCFNQNLYRLHNANPQKKDGTYYSKCYLRCEKKKTDRVNRYLYWCSMTPRRGRAAKDSSGQPQFNFRKLRRPQGETRLRIGLDMFSPQVQDYVKTYDPVFAIFDRVLVKSASSIVFNRRLIDSINIRIRPTNEIADEEFFHPCEDD